MRKPWQIWLVFLLALAAVIPAMGWLSVKTIQLDSLRETDRVETELARREAELQERISSALYRMDLKMLPLVAQEAARPYYFYDSFYRVSNPAIGIGQGNGLGPGGRNRGGSYGGLEASSEGLGGLSELAEATDSGVESIPSPLLFAPPEYVLLHFQIGPHQEISSPQRPVGLANDLAQTNYGVSRAAVDANEIRLRQASQFFKYDSLLAECSSVELSETDETKAENLDIRQSVYNVPAIEKLSQLLNQNQISDSELESLPAQTQRGNKSQVQRSRGESRVNTEFNRRLDSTKEFADQQWASNNAYDNPVGIGNEKTRPSKDAGTIGIREGVMQPRWVGDNLVLLRRIDGNKFSLVQGCWLDWPAIQVALKAEVADLLPNVQFQPIRVDSDLKIGTALTTIPVQLVVDSSNLLSTLAIDTDYDSLPTSGLRMSLWVAWLGLALAALASAMLLYGVIRLSERRAAFVSAVTHELRTPLTTFRMYAEMLAEKMVPEGKQQEYANTLRVQADRLSHLVENVLQFARLERGSGLNGTEKIRVNDLFARFESRLHERASEAEMELRLCIDNAIANVSMTTQPSTIEQIIFNLVDNACKYAQPSQERRIEVNCDKRGSQLRVRVRDYGPGVAPQYKKRMFQPFCKSDQDAANSASGVGLGLALCRRMAASLGGRLFHEDGSATYPGGATGAIFVFELPIAKSPSR